MSNVFGFVPDAGLISKKLLEGYVTIDTAQTITGEKIFNSDLLCTQDITTDNLVFGDGTTQSTAYKTLIPGTYRNSTITVDAFGAISLVNSGIALTPGAYTNTNITVDANGVISAVSSGSSGNFVTTDTVQTITANKTFSGTVRFGNSQLRSNGGTIAVALTGTSITAPLKDYYFLSGLSTGSSILTVPDATPALDGTEITFRRVVNTGGNLQIRQVNDVGNIYGPGLIGGLNNTVVMASTSFSCRILCANNNWYGIRDDV